MIYSNTTVTEYYPFQSIQATNGNFRHEEFVKFIELDKFVSGTSITKKCSLFSGTNKFLCTCMGADMQNSN